jgi:hypothetical protein
MNSLTPTTQAKIVWLLVQKTETFADEQSFGSAGVYEHPAGSYGGRILASTIWYRKTACSFSPKKKAERLIANELVRDGFMHPDDTRADMEKTQTNNTLN